MANAAPQVKREIDSPPNKGDQIREKIAANARRRFEIAKAMKVEAGVMAHDLTGERDGGIAWTDRAHILAPLGENKVQLATLAHECGHVFLHSQGTPGYLLPSHVKEMEAESYAHQAFKAHGMLMPVKVTNWGRHYVGRWVVNDRAAGIAIDPRVEAYVNGRRSPFEPLRLIPSPWQTQDLGAALWRKAPTIGVLARHEAQIQRPKWWSKLVRVMAPTFHEAHLVLSCGGFFGLLGVFAADFGTRYTTVRGWFPSLIVEPFEVYSNQHLAVTIVTGVVGAIIGVLWRTVRGLPEPQSR